MRIAITGTSGLIGHDLWPILSGISRQETWQQIARSIEQENPRADLIAPNDPLQLQHRDINDNGISDDREVYHFKERYPGNGDQGKLVWAVNYMEVLLSYLNTPLKGYADLLRSGGYTDFESASNGDQPGHIAIEDRDGLFIVRWDNRFNSESDSKVVLSLIHEVSRYLAEYDHGAVTLEDRLNELNFATKFMKDFGKEELFDWYKTYAGFPASLDYKTVLSAHQKYFGDSLIGLLSVYCFDHEVYTAREVLAREIQWAEIMELIKKAEFIKSLGMNIRNLTWIAPGKTKSAVDRRMLEKVAMLVSANGSSELGKEFLAKGNQQQKESVLAEYERLDFRNENLKLLENQL